MACKLQINKHLVANFSYKMSTTYFFTGSWLEQASHCAWVMVFRCEGLINSTVNTDWFQSSRIVQFFKNTTTSMVPEFNLLEVFTQIQLTQVLSQLHVCVIIPKTLKIVSLVSIQLSYTYVLKNQAPHLTLFTLHHY